MYRPPARPSIINIVLLMMPWTFFQCLVYPTFLPMNVFSDIPSEISNQQSIPFSGWSCPPLYPTFRTSCRSPFAEANSNPSPLPFVPSI
ncbi:hypothetical protein B0T20DRAFT_276787 [Sordaria brevicollis]|uniref:Uncharacterized protein n=1 Tax=Sordaria brevicollis TaxID=83679 RepID=A0AAE0PB23_SORBR|nr:hypothetical protein B0T20DRAFT_276787 [Sordaria brevicollis]